MTNSIRNVKVYGLGESLIRSGYPMQVGDPPDLSEILNPEDVYPDSLTVKRAKKLAWVPNGTGHDNFLKGIIVQFDWKHSITLAKQVERYH